MQSITTELDQELCAFLRGWDALEKSQGNEAIIDMALSEEGVAKPYPTRQSVLEDINRFLTCDEVKNHPQVLQKMTAHQHFLSKTLGTEIPFEEYFQQTMGFRPFLFSEQKIGALREQAAEALDVIGLKLDHRTQESLAELEGKVTDPVGVMNETHRNFYEKINRFLNLDSDFSVDYSLLPYDHKFLMWISGNGLNYTIQIHQERIKAYRPSRIKTIATHELTAHAVQFSVIRKQAEKNNWPHYMRLITVHEPIQFSSEGLAITLNMIYPEEFGETPLMRVTNALGRLNYCVVNNAGIRVVQGANYNDCMAYMNENGVHSEAFWTQTLDYIAGDTPLSTSYRLVYGMAQEAFLEVCGSHHNKNAFVKSVYEDFLMPQQILAQAKRPIETFI